MSVTNDIIFVTEIPLPNHDGIKDRHAALCFLPMLDGLNLEKVVLQLFREFNRGKKECSFLVMRNVKIRKSMYP